MRKLGILLALVTLLMAGLAGIIYAAPAITWITPSAAGADLGNAVAFNITVLAPGWNVSNATFEFKSNSNSTYTINLSSGDGCVGKETGGTDAICAQATISSHNQNCTCINRTLDTEDLAWLRDDDNDYTLRVTVYLMNVSNNSADYSTSRGSVSATRTFTADNTVPVCTHSQSSKTAYNPKQTWTITGSNASSATIQIGTEVFATMSENSATGDIFTYTGDITEGIYEITGITSDGLNTTTCILEFVQIDSESIISKLSGAGAFDRKKGAEAPPTPTKGIPNIVIWGGLAALAIIVWKRKKQ